MVQIYEIVLKNRGYIKIVINGYNNDERQTESDLNYWYCDKRKNVQLPVVMLVSFSSMDYIIWSIKEHDHSLDVSY